MPQPLRYSTLFSVLIRRGQLFPARWRLRDNRTEGSVMPQEAGRRAFLQFAAAAGGPALRAACPGNGTPQAAGDSATGTRSAASPSVSVQPAGSPVSPRAVSGPPTSADWAALARDLSGSLVRPGDADYTTAKRLFD